MLLQYTLLILSITVVTHGYSWWSRDNEYPFANKFTNDNGLGRDMFGLDFFNQGKGVSMYPFLGRHWHWSDSSSNNQREYMYPQQGGSDDGTRMLEYPSVSQDNGVGSDMFGFDLYSQDRKVPMYPSKERRWHWSSLSQNRRESMYPRLGGDGTRRHAMGVSMYRGRQFSEYPSFSQGRRGSMYIPYDDDNERQMSTYPRMSLFRRESMYPQSWSMYPSRNQDRRRYVYPRYSGDGRQSFMRSFTNSISKTKKTY